MTSKDMITSLASMTSLASKNQKKHAVYILSDFPGIRNLSASMTSTASVASMPHFIKKNYTAWCFHQTWHQNDISWSLNVGWIINFIDFWHPFFPRLWRIGMLLLTKLKGHKSNVHYSGFPKHLQTKSSLHISICQSKLKHKYLTLDTL
mgnify:CR=1 FL=1